MGTVLTFPQERARVPDGSPVRPNQAEIVILPVIRIEHHSGPDGGPINPADVFEAGPDHSNGGGGRRRRGAPRS
jgi:hypothetical protein